MIDEYKKLLMVELGLRQAEDLVCMDRVGKEFQVVLKSIRNRIKYIEKKEKMIMMAGYER